MKSAKRFLTGWSGIAVCAVALQLLAPRAVHAVVSALVTVANTPANPVPTLSVAKSPSQLVSLYGSASDGHIAELQEVSLGASYPGGATSPAGPIFVVPAGQTLVITDVDITACNGSTPPSTRIVVLQANDSTYVAGWNLHTDSTTHFSYAAGMVIPSGRTMDAFGANASELGVLLHGYLINNQ
jgi:hypothetical protein